MICAYLAGTKKTDFLFDSSLDDSNIISVGVNGASTPVRPLTWLRTAFSAAGYDFLEPERVLVVRGRKFEEVAEVNYKKGLVRFPDRKIEHIKKAKKAGEEELERLRLKQDLGAYLYRQSLIGFVVQSEYPQKIVIANSRIVEQVQKDLEELVLRQVILLDQKACV